MKLEPSEIAAIIALSGVVTSTMIAFVTASRSVYVNAITSARIRWLESIAERLIDFQHLHIAVASRKSSGGFSIDDVRQMHRSFNVIRLQLNRRSLNEQNLMRLLSLCSESYEDYETTEIYNTLFADHANWFIKTEWKKIKGEARSLLAWPNVTHEMRKRKRDYLRFCEGEGKIPAYEKPRA